MPKSPKVTVVPPLAAPVRRPRCCLRCLTFLGINMSVDLPAEVRRLVCSWRVRRSISSSSASWRSRASGSAGVATRSATGTSSPSVASSVAGAGAPRRRARWAPRRRGRRWSERPLLRPRFRRTPRRPRPGDALVAAATAATGGDESTGAALAGGLADGHGRLAGDLVLDGDLVREDVALVDPQP